MSAASSLAVVVPVGPDCAQLPDQLAALAAQEIPAHASIELILSCNGSAPATIEQWAARIPWPQEWSVRVIDSSIRRGPGHARNAGWRASTADRVLFCDADDLVSEGWLLALSSALDRAEVVGGLNDFSRLNSGQIGTWGVDVRDLPVKFSHLPFAPSGNLGVRRSALELLNGFDEWFERSEDVDFSWRAAYAGLDVARAPDAVLHVRRRDTLRSLYIQSRDDAQHDAALYQRHRSHGARWSTWIVLREATAAGAALFQAPFGGRHRAKLAARAGRFIGHAVALPDMLRAAPPAPATHRDSA